MLLRPWKPLRMNNATSDIATRFYQALQQRDAKGMIVNYHPELEFTDPAFGRLNYLHTGAMWQMLCSSAADLKIGFSVIHASETEVTTKWTAKYTFGKTGRLVHNEIMASMEIKVGKIIRHVDEFNLYKWAKQALGVQGWLIGATPYFKKKLQQQTNRQLLRFMAKNKIS